MSNANERPQTIAFDWSSLTDFIAGLQLTCQHSCVQKGFRRGGKREEHNYSLCGKPLKVAVKSDFGLAYHLRLSCGTPDHTEKLFWTSPRADTQTSHEKFAINKRFLIAGIDADLRFEKLNQFGELLGIGSFSPTTFDDIRAEAGSALDQVNAILAHFEMLHLTLNTVISHFTYQ